VRACQNNLDLAHFADPTKNTIELAEATIDGDAVTTRDPSRRSDHCHPEAPNALSGRGDLRSAHRTPPPFMSPPIRKVAKRVLILAVFGGRVTRQ
jgi:hypothetical protein